MSDIIGDHVSAWKDKGGIYNLSQGIVNWKPPKSAIESGIMKKREASSSESESEQATEKSPKVTPSDHLPLPRSTAAGRKWLDAVKATRAHPRFSAMFDFQKMKEQYGVLHPWVKTKPFGKWCADFPQVISIDCEMCETQDPLSGEKDHCALCRISVIDAENDEVLLDTLVKPAWPVTKYRTWVNGITADDLKSVEFTLRHAQAFMMAICSEETVICGHCLHKDFAALRMDHSCVVDSALLFKASDSDRATVSLKDLARSLLKKEMPNKHDSIDGARTALTCLKHFVEKDGEVDSVIRTFKNHQPEDGSERINYGSQLFIHRIPANVKEEDLSTMFLKFASVEPVKVNPIELGKTRVYFRSTIHADLAFDSLAGEAELDSSSRLQKDVFLRNKSALVRVRKMTFPAEKNDDKTSDSHDSASD